MIVDDVPAVTTTNLEKRQREEISSQENEAKSPEEVISPMLPQQIEVVSSLDQPRLMQQRATAPIFTQQQQMAAMMQQPYGFSQFYAPAQQQQ